MAKTTPEPWHRRHFKNGSNEEWILYSGGGDRVTEVGRIYALADIKRIQGCVTACRYLTDDGLLADPLTQLLNQAELLASLLQQATAGQPGLSADERESRQLAVDEAQSLCQRLRRKGHGVI